MRTEHAWSAGVLQKLLLSLAIVVTSILWSASSWAGSIFLTGHDPDFHASLGGNLLGAQHINQIAINFVTDPSFNPFTAGGINKFLFVESTGTPPSGHTIGANGLVASGFTVGTSFDIVNASTLNVALNNLGTTYNAIVVASDFGGILTQSELNILNARSADIIAFLNAGGGLYAMAESNSGAHLTPAGGQFGFLPFVVSSTAFDQTEIGITVTPFGAGLGLTNSDVNGNASHNIFSGTFGLNVVDIDQFGNTLTLAGRGVVNGGGVGVGVVPEPSTLVLLTTGLGLAAWRGITRRASPPI